MALTKLQKFFIAAVVILFVIGILALVFALLSWTDLHDHNTPSCIGPGLLGLASLTGKELNQGLRMHLYDYNTGRRKSGNLFTRRTMNQDTRICFGRGQVETEMVDIWETQNIRYVRKFNLENLGQRPILLKIAQNNTDIAWDMAGGKFMNRGAITWDSIRARWLACLYTDSGAGSWELLAIDPLTGDDTLVPAAVGSGPDKPTFAGAYGGCMGLMFCGSRLFALFGRYDDTTYPGYGFLVEFNPDTGAVMSSHEWRTGTGLPVTTNPFPEVATKNMLDMITGFTFDEANQRVYFVLGGEYRVFGWVNLTEIPSPLGPFNIHVATDHVADFITDVVYLPAKVNLPEYPEYHEVHPSRRTH